MRATRCMTTAVAQHSILEDAELSYSHQVIKSLNLIFNLKVVFV